MLSVIKAIDIILSVFILNVMAPYQIKLPATHFMPKFSYPCVDNNFVEIGTSSE